MRTRVILSLYLAVGYIWGAVAFGQAVIEEVSATPAPGAQKPAAVQPQVTNRKQAEQAKATLEKWIKLQEERVNTLTEDMADIDRDIEMRVDRIVDLLTKSKDSVDSGTKILNRKRDAIKGLKKSMEAYSRERAKRREQVLRPTYMNTPASVLTNDVVVLDARIEKRIDQILEIASSFAEHKDYKRNTTHSVNVYHGGYGYSRPRTVEVDEKYQQNQKVTGRATNTREKIAKELDDSVQRLKQENRRLENQLKMTVNPDQAGYLKDRMDWNKELIRKRDQQKWAMIKDRKPAGKKVSRDAANSLGRLMDEERDQIRDIYRQLVSLRSRRDQERSKLTHLNNRLAQVNRVLAQSAPDAGQ
jgi:hypothetical protein